MAGRRPEIEMDIKDLKLALGLVERNSRATGWIDEQCENRRDFRKQLKAARSAFDEVSSISATFMGIRNGRKIGSVRFVIQAVKPIPLLGIQPMLFEDTMNGVATEEALARVTGRLQVLKLTCSAQRLVDEHELEVVDRRRHY
jgi:plasmid replication initiation protein